MTLSSAPWAPPPMMLYGPLPPLRERASAFFFLRLALVWGVGGGWRECCLWLTLADGLPPDVLDGAGSEAVDALDLVGPNDGVLQGTALLDDEDGVILASFALAGAGDTTAVGLVATVVGLAGGDFVGLVKGHAAFGVGDGELGGQGAAGEQGEEKALLIHADLEKDKQYSSQN